MLKMDLLVGTLFTYTKDTFLPPVWKKNILISLCCTQLVGSITGRRNGVGQPLGEFKNWICGFHRHPSRIKLECFFCKWERGKKGIIGEDTRKFITNTPSIVCISVLVVLYILSCITYSRIPYPSKYNVHTYTNTYQHTALMIHKAGGQ